MKNNKTHKKNGNGSLTKAVHVKFSHQTARTVAIAGTFNNW
jgi:hypothetical protein